MARSSNSVEELIQSGLAQAADRYRDEEPHLAAACRQDDGEDPEHVHRARTSIRRLRALLWVARPYVAAPSGKQVRNLRAELRWIGGLLGGVRDADVMAGHVGDLADRTGIGLSTSVISTRLGGIRAESALTLAEGLGSERYRALMSAMSAVGTIGFRSRASKSGREELPALVGTEFGRLEKMVVRSTNDPPSLHAVRIQAKKCRYTAEVAVPCCGKPAGRLVSALTELQDTLGLHHDMVVLADWLRSDAAIAATDAGPLLEQRALAEVDRIASSWHDVWRHCRSSRVTGWLG